jgi:glutathione S-transferase
MFKLYGFPSSNYVNMVELALLEKGIPFEYEMIYPEPNPDLLSKSPRGKVPFLETPQGFLNESGVILEYLEDIGEGMALLPKDPYERAQVRALMREIELYIELPARACYLEAIFGLSVPDAIKSKAREELLAGFATLKRHGKFSPYVAGKTMTLADIVFLYTVDLAALVGQKQFGVDLLADMPEARELMGMLGARPHVQSVAARRDAHVPGFIAAIRARYLSA